MIKKEAEASDFEALLEKMTVEELFRLLSEKDREFIRGYIEQALSESVSKTENKK